MNFGDFPGDTNTNECVSMMFDFLSNKGGGWNSSHQITRECDVECELWFEEEEEQATSTLNGEKNDSQSPNKSCMDIEYYLHHAAPPSFKELEALGQALDCIPQASSKEQEQFKKALDSLYNTIVNDVSHHVWQKPAMEADMEEAG